MWNFCYCCVLHCDLRKYLLLLLRVLFKHDVARNGSAHHFTPTTTKTRTYVAQQFPSSRNSPSLSHVTTMDDENEYLQPNFDPTTLRVADLRRILLFHDVDFPSSAKKGQLVSLFLDNITPKAKSILQKKSRVRPSNKGIIKVETDENGEVQPQIYLPGVSLLIFLFTYNVSRRRHLEHHLGRENLQ